MLSICLMEKPQIEVEKNVYEIEFKHFLSHPYRYMWHEIKPAATATITVAHNNSGEKFSTNKFNIQYNISLFDSFILLFDISMWNVRRIVRKRWA